MTPLYWRPSALDDVDNAAAWYGSHGGLTLELAFIDELAATTELISRHPAVGSVRHAWLLPELPAPLRFHPLDRFDRYLVYYIEMPGYVDIVRVWNSARGLEELQSTTSE